MQILINAAKRIIGLYPLYYNYRIRLYYRKLLKQPATVAYQPDNITGSIAKLLILHKAYIKEVRDEDLSEAATNGITATKSPLVSAMLVTKDRPAQAWRAIESFLAQSYANKELIIIDEGGTKLQDQLKSLGDLSQHNIHYQRNEVPTTLGELRNRAVDLAQGDYVCQWDDDDLYHPDRLSFQLLACLQHHAVGCFLIRQVILRQNQGKQEMAISSYRLWEGTIMARKDAISKYPHMARAEDTPVVNRLVLKHKIVGLDLPQLYIYNMHGENTWHQEHMQKMWQASSVIFKPAEATEKYQELAQIYQGLK